MVYGEVAEGHIVPLTFWSAAESFINYLFGFGYLFFAKQLPYLFKIRESGSVIPLAVSARPYGILVELYGLAKGLAKTHTAYPAVTDRQSNIPVFCGSLEPYPFVDHKHTAILLKRHIYKYYNIFELKSKDPVLMEIPRKRVLTFPSQRVNVSKM
jgi:hypothetical protein